MKTNFVNLSKRVKKHNNNYLRSSRHSNNYLRSSRNTTITIWSFNLNTFILLCNKCLNMWKYKSKLDSFIESFILWQGKTRQSFFHLVLLWRSFKIYLEFKFLDRESRGKQPNSILRTLSRTSEYREQTGVQKPGIS